MPIFFSFYNTAALTSLRMSLIASDMKSPVALPSVTVPPIIL